MNVVYLSNQYPKISHTFVRTEIAAVEQAGVRVHRVGVRSVEPQLRDPADRLEAQRTRIVLDAGTSGLLVALLRTAALRPKRFAKALRLALKMAWPSNRGVAYHLAYLAEACVLLAWTDEWHIDHLHASFSTSVAEVALLCRILGGPPYSFAAHASSDFDCAYQLSLPEKVEHAAFVVVVSEVGRRRLQQICPTYPPSRIHVVRCCVDPRFLATQPAPVPTEKRLVFVGRLEADKAPDALIDAMSANVDDAECELVIIGDGSLRTPLEARVRELGLQTRVRFLGWVASDEVIRQLLRCRALVLPSVNEGIPVVLMEALALGRPVICTPVGGITELVEDGECGWVVPTGSVVALAQAIREVLAASPEDLETLGRNGAERVARQHHPASAGRKLASLFADSTASWVRSEEPAHS